ncbi:MAG: ABC transporter ATP-binding protein [Nitrospinae bacterium]|nr:ABC transporter ATP-binding protein [Nitrospinota bacterium]MBI3813124.1 ABC transporter ATP-binding protein [Nitrospinota bacterium]
MSDIVIRAENLSKLYRIGSRESYKTLRDVLTDAIYAPLRWFRKSNSGLQTPNSNFIWALKDVSFEVNHGEVVGIIGRNGAGKSTLLKILSRITEPTAGYARIYGRVGSLLEVGTGFHPDLTGRENIYLNGSIIGMKKAEIDRKFNDIVTFAEIEKFIDTQVKHYSSGMYVRLAFAVAAHLEPEILLVDEVLAVGDAAFQKKCIGKMGDVAKEGRTVVFVSHNMVSVSSLCNRVILLKGGQIIEDSKPSIAIERYLRESFADQTVDIRVRQDRIGLGKVRFTKVRLLNNSGEQINSIGMGESLTVEAEFEVNSELTNPVFGVLIDNMFGETVLRGYSRESSSFVPDVCGSGKITCTFPKIPLMHGVYGISLWVSILRECVDFVRNTTKLVIEPADVYKTGVRPEKDGGGLCFTDHLWRFDYLSNRLK